MPGDPARLARNHGLPLLLYLGLALLMTWPLAGQFGAGVPGDSVDSWQNIWNMWWLKKALLEGRNPFSTEMIYYPGGTSLLLHTLNPFNFLISLPFHALFGLVVAYNVALLFSLVSSGYAAYLLAADVTGSRRAALVGGAVFACSGYLLAQALGHLNLIAAEWLPFAALALRRAGAAPGLSMRRILLAALCIALNVLCDWQYFLFALLWSGWYALALAWQQRTLRAALPAVLAAGLALLFALPLLLPTASLAAATPGADTGQSYRLGSSADLSDFLLPSQLHPLWGAAAAQAQAYKATTIIHNKTAYLGTATLALAVLALWHAWQRRAQPKARPWVDRPSFWLASTLLFLLLAMGPRLQVAGHLTDVPLPAALFYALPLVNISRVPLRFMALAMLGLAVLAAFGTRPLLAAVQQQAQQPLLAGRLLVAVLVGLVALDNLVAPFPFVGIYVPPIYAEMREDGEDYAILESPAYARTSVIYMFYQVIHGKPLVGGNISREQPYPLRDEIPLVRLYTSAEPVYDIIGQEFTEIAPSVFSYFNIRYLLLHSEGGALSYHVLRQAAQAAAGGGDPQQISIPGRSFLVYRVEPPAEPLPFLGIGAGWSPAERRANGAVVRSLREAGEILVYTAVPGQATLHVWLHRDNQAAGLLHPQINGEPLPQQPIAAGEQRLAIPLQLEAGVTRVQLGFAGSGAVLVQRLDIER